MARLPTSRKSGVGGDRRQRHQKIAGTTALYSITLRTIPSKAIDNCGLRFTVRRLISILKNNECSNSDFLADMLRVLIISLFGCHVHNIPGSQLNIRDNSLFAEQ